MSRQIVICVQQRYAPNPTSCAHHGSLRVLGAMRKAIAESGVSLELVTSGCMGMCLKGPNIKLLPDGVVWNGVGEEQVADIIEYTNQYK